LMLPGFVDDDETDGGWNDPRFNPGDVRTR
jgi:hypothetical protein